MVLVHGSSADSRSLHVLAHALAQSGQMAYALDMRGHGESLPKGHIRHIGQLDDDLQDFMQQVQPRRPTALAGFSSGGGFALRVAASERQTLFDHDLLLAPFISHDAPTYRPQAGGRVSVGVPRIVGLSLLDALGVHALHTLPVMHFALNEQAREMMTPSYSFTLASNFRPPRDWRAAIRAAGRPMRVLAGQDDEAVFAGRYAALFEAEGRRVPVTLLPGIGHVGLTLQPRALQAVAAAVAELQALPPAVAAR